MRITLGLCEDRTLEGLNHEQPGRLPPAMIKAIAGVHVVVLDQPVTLAGSHFYTSAGFWVPAIGVIVGLLTIAATIWVTLRAANPKRRLYYWISTDTPLLTKQRDLSHELRVTYGTVKVDSPRVVTVVLTSRGRRDISHKEFDEGKPLCLDLGTPIVECVDTTISPPDSPDLSYATDGSKLLIGPSHFSRRQTTVFSLLVDGKAPRVVPPRQSLVDVKIRPGPDAQISITSVVVQITFLAGALWAFQGLISNIYHDNQAFEKKVAKVGLGAAGSVPFTSADFVALTFTVLFLIGLFWYRRRIRDQSRRREPDPSLVRKYRGERHDQ